MLIWILAVLAGAAIGTAVRLIVLGRDYEKECQKFVAQYDAISLGISKKCQKTPRQYPKKFDYSKKTEEG